MDIIDVTRGKVTVVDDQHTPGTIYAETKLNTEPGADWRGYFDRPSGVTFTTTMRKPELRGQRVHLQVSRPEDLPALVAYVDGAIDWANRQFRAVVIPGLQREARLKADRQAEAQKDLQRAKDIAKDL